MKTKDFNMENTHLTEIKRIEKLHALVILAFTWAYEVSDHLNQYITTIKIKEHGKSAGSIFKHGKKCIIISTRGKE